MPDKPPPRSAAETVRGLDPRALLSRAARPPGSDGVQCIGDYELLEQISEGGMGVVYRAHQVSLQRTVALKMIRSGLLATLTEVQRFRREAEAAASLDHPHIVPIYEIGESDGRHFFSMKFIEGGNLAELSAACDEARRRSAEWVRRAAGIVAKMARAVHHAHQRGVLHRDVKPTNVLLDEHGEPHLTDFGLAKLAEGGSGMTMTLAVIGTPNYMAPEQAAGSNRQLTVAADIYSLGAVLYELLSGRPPFEADSTLELLRQVQESEPPALRKSNPGLNRDLETICLKCLQKEPPRRYATAEELAADLDRWLAGKPILARPVAPLKKFWLWSRRNPAAPIAGALLLALAVVSTLAAIRLRGQRNEINENLRSALLAQARVQRVGTEAGRRAESLRVLSQAARIRPSIEVRNEVIAALALPELGPPQTWYASKPKLNTVQRMLTTDGERYVLFGEPEGIKVHRRSDGAVLAELATPPAHQFYGKLSPDGRYLINYDRARSVFVWDLNRAGSGPLAHAFALPGPWEFDPDFTPDSRSLALAGRDKRVRYADPASGRVLFETKDTGKIQPTRDGKYFAAHYEPGGIGAREILRSGVFRTLTSARTGYPDLSGVDISPDGRWLVSGAAAGLHVWDLAQGNEAAFVASASATRPRFHPSGAFIVAGGEGQLLRWPLSGPEGGGEVRVAPAEVMLSAPGDNFGEVSFTPDGEWVAVPARRGSFVMKWSDPSQRVVVGDKANVPGHDYVVLSPDKSWVAGASYPGVDVTALNAPENLNVRRLIENENAGLAVSPDARTLATATAHELVLWDTATWQPRRRIATGLPAGDPVPVVFSPDGSLLAVAATRQEIQLLDARTGDPLATLTPPLPMNLVTMRFSADSRHLAVQTLGPIIHLWDLHALRRELRALGLDW